MAAYSVYAVCRISDDIVDSSTRASTQSIDSMHKKIHDAYSDKPLEDPILIEFRKTVKTYQIPKEHFDDLIAGMYMDLTKHRYQNFDELYDYCYKVAGVIGLIMLKIFDDNAEAEPYAVKLGIAMQLTNIIRDVKEDYALGRIYLPADEMSEFNITEQDIANEIMNDNMKNFIRSQIKRSRVYYDECTPGIRMNRDKRCRFVIYVMKELYAGILESIERNDLNVFSQRAYLTMPRKIGKTLRIISKQPFEK